jgi:hypothetical protein
MSKCVVSRIMFDRDDVIDLVQLINSNEFVAQNNGLEFACEGSGKLRKMSIIIFE